MKPTPGQVAEAFNRNANACIRTFNEAMLPGVYTTLGATTITFLLAAKDMVTARLEENPELTVAEAFDDAIETLTQGFTGPTAWEDCLATSKEAYEKRIKPLLSEPQREDPLNLGSLMESLEAAFGKGNVIPIGFSLEKREE